MRVLSYLSAVLYAAFMKRPEVLKEKGKMIDWATVLSQATIGDIVHVLAERKVNELAYKSFGDVRDYFEKERGISVASEAQRKVITKAVAIRNISVHNGCVINEQFVKLVPETSRSSIGRLHWLKLDDFEPLAITLGELVTDLDRRAATHFKLEHYPLEVDPRKHPLGDEPPPISDDPN